MESLQLILLVFQVTIAVSLIALILVQHGKGADAGAAFGSGSSSAVFGSQGSGNFLTKTTSVFAFLFLANSLILGYMATQQIVEPESIMTEESILTENALIPAGGNSITVGSEPSSVENDPASMDDELAVLKTMVKEETTKEETINIDVPLVDALKPDVPSIPEDSIPK